MTDHSVEIDTLTRSELYFSIRQITRTVRRYADVFDGDYDAAMIFLIVAESGFRAIFPLAAIEPDLPRLEEAYMDPATLGVTLMNLGEATGIARETVRRKVNNLVAKGILAVFDKNRTIYVPLSTLLAAKFQDLFGSQNSDVMQLVKTVRFYSKSAPE